MEHLVVTEAGLLFLNINEPMVIKEGYCRWERGLKEEYLARQNGAVKFPVRNYRDELARSKQPKSPQLELRLA